MLQHPRLLAEFEERRLSPLCWIRDPGFGPLALLRDPAADAPTSKHGLQECLHHWLGFDKSVECVIELAANDVDVESLDRLLERFSDKPRPVRTSFDHTVWRAFAWLKLDEAVRACEVLQPRRIPHEQVTLHADADARLNWMYVRENLSDIMECMRSRLTQYYSEDPRGCDQQVKIFGSLSDGLRQLYLDYAYVCSDQIFVTLRQQRTSVSAHFGVEPEKPPFLFEVIK